VIQKKLLGDVREERVMLLPMSVDAEDGDVRFNRRRANSANKKTRENKRGGEVPSILILIECEEFVALLEAIRPDVRKLGMVMTKDGR